MEGKGPERNENTNQINDGDMPNQSQRRNSDSLVVDLTSDPFREYQDSHLNTESVAEFWKLANTIISEKVRWILGLILETSQQPTPSSQSHPPKHSSNLRLYNVQTRSFPSTPVSRSLTVQQYIDTFNEVTHYQQAKPRKAIRVNERGISNQKMIHLRQHIEFLRDMTERRIAALYNRRRRNRKVSKHRRIDDIEQQFVGISLSDNMLRQSAPPSSDVPFPEATEELHPLQSNAPTSNPTQVELEDFEKSVEGMSEGEE